MKKVCIILAMVSIMLTSCVIDGEIIPSVNVKENSRNVVIFLYDATCERSVAAKQYFEENYFNAAHVYVDITGTNNLDYLKSVKYYYKNGDGNIQTPIICFGDNFIEGWDYTKENMVDVLIQPYLRK